MAGDLRHWTLTVVTALVVAALAAPLASAKTLKVTRHGDPSPGGCTARDCSLREAVIAANKHPGSDEIVVHGGGTYRLAIPPAGTDNEATGDLNITDRVKIASSNAGPATIDAQHIDRVFDIGPAGPASAVFSHLSIRGGVTGGGDGGGVLLEHGSLSVSHSSVSDDTASFGGGIAASLTTSLRLSRSKVSGDRAVVNGGGVSTDGSTVVSKSTIRGNRAVSAGGGLLEEDGNPGVMVKNSTISGNHSSGQGGGISVDSKSITLLDDTLAKNTTKGNGGAVFDGGTVRMNSVTVAYNRSDADANGMGSGGGLWVDPVAVAFHVRNSLVTRNSAGAASGPDCGSSINQFLSGGHNLIGTTRGCSGFGPSYGVNTDIVNPRASKIRIGELAANGGPTKTIALLKGSVAIDHAGRQTAEKRDQRGVKRDARPDIGAYERR